jgi:hypothetical protein
MLTFQLSLRLKPSQYAWLTRPRRANVNAGYQRLSGVSGALIPWFWRVLKRPRISASHYRIPSHFLKSDEMLYPENIWISVIASAFAQFT